MKTAAIEPEVATQISLVRDFNRFYTARLDLLRRRHLDGEFSLTEGRVLYEIGANPQIKALTLCRILELDAGYISRVLSALARRKLILHQASIADGREKLLALTALGKKAVARINEQSTMQIHGMISNLDPADRKALAASLAKARGILSSPKKLPVRIVRLKVVDAEAYEILREYYEAVHVVLRDKPGTIEEIIAMPASGMWLAYLGDKVAGCVVLRKMDSIPRASECKRLYVRPFARGNGIADKLLDAQEAFARSRKVEWIYLDTYHDLTTAIALYERRGYRPCKRYNNNPQATLFMRKNIAV